MTDMKSEGWMLTTRKSLMWVVAAFSVLVVAALIVWLLGSSKPAESAPVTPSQSPTTQPTESASAVPPEISTVISNLPADPGNLVSQSSPFREQFAAAFPPGTTTKTVQETWAANGDNQGVVQVDISRPGAAEAKYAAMMVKENGQWKLLATVEVQP
ncbi:hypothetical protein [Arthrobacter bambusae]|uniref:DUF4878 domain-containing protein n=1 Tax=Arthrobacter bambusae TaxID=1338426 RepID=A0AAW8DG39_9MICC|nr:hypothetical protein [Arthrobacter bambusae]MDP9905599.1 hypothetical protein [Arthrobacter bambusae]MDQ0127319.1 hypothetical protein [Arthrobacter bambusae]MDQ0178661.1 hypothetical protein [Arthrobacter bambusae]